MLWWKVVLGGVVVLAILPIGAGQLGLLRGKPPENLGVRHGKLRPPSRTPNSVSSQADLWPGHAQLDYARIAPLSYQGDGTAAMERLRRVIEAMAGAHVVTATADYLHVEFETRWLRFVDDAEFWLDPAGGVIQLRSASRMGRKDFGVNRARIEAIRAAFSRAQAGGS